MRERGLKHSITHAAALRAESLLVRERGLKPVTLVVGDSGVKSLLVRGGGLKPRHTAVDQLLDLALPGRARG